MVLVVVKVVVKFNSNICIPIIQYTNIQRLRIITL